MKAIESVKAGNSTRKAATAFNVPRTTLLFRLSNNKPGKLALGGKPTLGDIENELVKHALDMEKSLFGITATDLRKLAYQVRFISTGHVNV